MKAIYPGSFDPITHERFDLIERSCRMFEMVIVLVAINPEKRYLFSLSERMTFCEV